jgi:probable HAF family extracellular repeat protein
VTETVNSINFLNIMKFRKLLIIGIFISLKSCLCAQQLTNLGAIEPVGINDTDQIAATGQLPSGSQRAYLYSNGQTTELGTLGGSSSMAAGINSSGEIVGLSQAGNDSVGVPEQHAFLFTGAALEDLNSFAQPLPNEPDFQDDVANGINNAGQIVGVSVFTRTNSNSTFYVSDAFIISNGIMTDLGSLGTINPNGDIYQTGTYGSGANGVNTSGDVVGWTYTSSGSAVSQAAFLTTHGAAMRAIGNLGGNSYAQAINDSDQIVGASYTSTSNLNQHAFLYSGGRMIDLGTLGGASSQASAINNSGEVVGGSLITNSTTVAHAFVYTTALGMQDMNTLYASLLVSGTGSQTGFVYLENASSINTQGDIAGIGMYYNGSTTTLNGFLLQVSSTSSSTGSLQVTLSPAGAVSAGAQWQVDGGTLQASGATVAGLSLGSHPVTFTNVSGYTTPSSQSATIVANTTTQLTGVYTSAQANTVTFAQWQVLKFGANATNSLIAGPTATPQNDGVPNLLKYLYDINPTGPMSSNDRAALPILHTVTVSGTAYLTLTYRQYAEETGLAFKVQASNNLVTWSDDTTPADQPQPTGVTDPTSTPPDPFMQLRVPVTGTPQFIRLQVIGP